MSRRFSKLWAWTSSDLRSWCKDLCCWERNVGHYQWMVVMPSPTVKPQRRKMEILLKWKDGTKTFGSKMTWMIEEERRKEKGVSCELTSLCSRTWLEWRELDWLPRKNTARMEAGVCSVYLRLIDPILVDCRSICLTLLHEYCCGEIVRCCNTCKGLMKHFLRTSIIARRQ